MMADDNNRRFQEIFNAAKKAYPQDSKATVQKKAVKLWHEVKDEEAKDKSSSIYNDTIAKLNNESMRSKSKLQGFWSSQKLKPPREETVKLHSPAVTNAESDPIQVEDDQPASDTQQRQQQPVAEATRDKRAERKTHAQDELNKELGKINDELASYAVIKERTGLSKEYLERVESLTSQKIDVENG